MKNELDDLLKHALTPIDEPDFRLNQSIINQVKEQERMKKRIWKRFPAAALISVIVLGCASLTVFAGVVVKYLSARDVTERIEDTKLADAFSNEDAIFINETQSYGGYDVTLMGIVSGKNISDYIASSNGVPMEDRTYAVVAIAYSDGTPFPEIMNDPVYDKELFCVSLLIRDFNPIFYNTYAFSGGYQRFVENGVLYWIEECKNVEIFADHGLYVCVCDNGPFYNSEAYQFDETTGVISRNEDYEGLNALFNLPIDVSKADPEAAKKLLKEAGYGGREGEPDLDEDKPNLDEKDKPDLDEYNYRDQDKWRHQITPENIDEYADRLEDSVQVLTPDAEGFIHYEYKDAEGNQIADGKTTIGYLFEQEERFIIKGIGWAGRTKEGKAKEAHINTLQANDDGTVTYACYRVKQSVLESE